MCYEKSALHQRNYTAIGRMYHLEINTSKPHLPYACTTPFSSKPYYANNRSSPQPTGNQLHPIQDRTTRVNLKDTFPWIGHGCNGVVTTPAMLITGCSDRCPTRSGHERQRHAGDLHAYAGHQSTSLRLGCRDVKVLEAVC